MGEWRKMIMMQFKPMYWVECLRSAGNNGSGLSFLAGLGIGFWESQQAIVDAWNVEGHFVPAMDETTVSKHVAQWSVLCPESKLSKDSSKSEEYRVAVYG